jgi:hypothetical protein
MYSQQKTENLKMLWKLEICKLIPHVVGFLRLKMEVLLSVPSTRIKMKCCVVLSAVVACGLAAPVAEAEADAQLLAGTYGHGLVGGVYGAGLGGVYGAGLGGVYAAGHAVAAPAVATIAHAAPAVATYAHAAPAVATYAHAAPVAVAHAAPVAIATAPVVQHVGYNVHRQVHHVPQVSVQKHVSTHTTTHVINHAPVVGAALAHGVVAAPAVAGVAGVVAV